MNNINYAFLVSTLALHFSFGRAFWQYPAVYPPPVVRHNRNGKLLQRLNHSSSRTGDVTEKTHIALTREDGKNLKLMQALTNEFGSSIQMHELPCIEHADGKDYDRLPEALESREWEYIIVTSPEAARVLGSAWKEHMRHKVAAVGQATQETLEQLGIAVEFTPSKATAKVLVEELEVDQGTRVLYPSSAQALSTLEDGLRARGITVTRLNTYDTVTATWAVDQKRTAELCQIACFASPSSVKGWLANTNRKEILTACIGETSAQACRDKGWKEQHIFFPDKPGITGWVDAVKRAIENVKIHSV